MESSERLISCIESKDWETLMTLLKPKDFCSEIPRTLDDFVKVLKAAELLLDENVNISEKIRNNLLKCLANSCVNGYIQKPYIPKNNENISNRNSIYKFLSQEVFKWNEEKSYPFHTHFPFEGIVRWVVQTIVEYNDHKKKLSEDQFEILRLSLQFLCNFFTFAFNISTSSNTDNVMEYIKDQKFINTIIILVGHDRAPIARAACAYVHNMVKQHFKDFYLSINKKELTTELIKSTVADIQAALDTITLLLNEPHYLKDVYDEISIDDKLYLLDIIFQTVRSFPYDEMNENSTVLQLEATTFLCDIFKKKSDLVFKSVEAQMNDLDLTEITILLDILGIVTFKSTKEQCQKLQDDTSLIVNCLFLLKGVHLSGKESNNCFTPLQKLSDLSLSTKNNCCNEAKDPNNHTCFKNIEAHPAYRFKARLIRVIGNLVHKHKKNQNLVRENDGIPLLLDCCNIDGRNPLITQWSIFVIRNLLEDNPENQEVIRKSVKVGVVENSVIRELGLTLNEGEENAIGIMPLP